MITRKKYGRITHFESFPVLYFLYYLTLPIISCKALVLEHIVDIGKVFLTSNEDFRDRHLSYWSSSHFFKLETTNQFERKEKSFIQYWFLHTTQLDIANTMCSILTLPKRALLFALSAVWSTLKVRSEISKEWEKASISIWGMRAYNRVSSLHPPSTITDVKNYWKSFLFSFRLFRYAYNRMTRGCIL